MTAECGRSPDHAAPRKASRSRSFRRQPAVASRGADCSIARRTAIDAPRRGRRRSSMQQLNRRIALLPTPNQERRPPGFRTSAFSRLRHPARDRSLANRTNSRSRSVLAHRWLAPAGLGVALGRQSTSKRSAAQGGKGIVRQAAAARSHSARCNRADGQGGTIAPGWRS